MIAAGLTAGRDLWSVPAQPAYVAGTQPALFDTMAVARTLVPGLVVTVALSYARWSRTAIDIEGGYFGAASRQHCVPVAPFAAEAERFNEQVCTSANGRRVATAIAGLLVGATHRWTAGRAQLLVRASVGAGQTINSFVTTEGDVVSSRCGNGVTSACTVALYETDEHSVFTPLAALGAGLALRVGRASRLRFEVRDLVANLPVVEGAQPLTQPFVSRSHTLTHVPLVSAGYEVVVDSHYQRRY